MYIGLAFVVLLGAAALVVDLGVAYRRQADLQKVSDNAALAGASSLQQGYAVADAEARKIATMNGYTSGVDRVTIKTLQVSPIRFRTTISRDEPTYFAKVLRKDLTKVSATATAEYTSYAGMMVTNNGNVSSVQAALVNNGPYALGPIGNASYNSYGDYFSALYTSNASGTNPRYDPNGYNFLLTVPADFQRKTKAHSSDDHSKLWIEIFDPESHADYDEIHSASNEVKALLKKQSNFTPSDKNRTTYTVFYDSLSAHGDVTSSTALMSREFDPTKSDYTQFNGKWTEGMFEVNLNNVNLTQGRLRLQIKSTDGASENGFYIRTGPKRATGINDSTWQTRYGATSASNGTTFVAEGRVSFNFWKAGTANIDLGFVPATAAGGNVRITYYDLEGGKSLKLFCSNNANSGIAANGKSVSFQKVNGLEGYIDHALPANFSGGTFSMIYEAGSGDSSSWQVSYPGPGKKSLRLVE